MPKRLVSAQEFAAMLGVTKYHIRRLVEERRVPQADFVIGDTSIRGWEPKRAKDAAKAFYRLRRK